MNVMDRLAELQFERFQRLRRYDASTEEERAELFRVALDAELGARRADIRRDLQRAQRLGLLGGLFLGALVGAVASLASVGAL